MCGRKSVWSCLYARKAVEYVRKEGCVESLVKEGFVESEWNLVVGHLCLQDCTRLVCQCFLVFRAKVCDPGKMNMY